MMGTSVTRTMLRALGEHFGSRHQADVGHAQRAGRGAEAGSCRWR